MSGWTRPAEVKLLSGGNPQIAKGDGDATVRLYIEHMPEWKHDLGQRIDELIADAYRLLPNRTRRPALSAHLVGVQAGST